MNTNHSSFLNGAIGTRFDDQPERGLNWFRRLLRAIATYEKQRRDYELLLDMPDHMLDDIGLDRSTIRKEQNRLQLFPWGRFG